MSGRMEFLTQLSQQASEQYIKDFIEVNLLHTK